MTRPIVFALALLGPHPAYGGGTPLALDDLGIEVHTPSRPVVYTNKQTAFWYGETGARNRTGWQGFNVFGHEMFDEYRLWLGDRELDPATALRTVVYPDRLVREFPGGIREEVCPADSLALIGVILTAPEPLPLKVIPFFTDGRHRSDWVVRPARGGTALARSNHTRRSPDRDYPPWLALAGKNFTTMEESTATGVQFSPVVAGAGPARTHRFALAAGDDPDDASVAAQRFVDDAETLIGRRRERLARLLAETQVSTDDGRFDRALAWAKLSLDALLMNQRTPGIFAGLPWFNNYWGRDTFIALPGATLVTGRFDDAKSILRSFSAFQQTDPASPDEGRIPNLVTPADTAYNTADGTPRFVITALDYVLRSGDTAFATEVYPVVHRSIEGTIRHHMDDRGFLTHGDAETWMDAVGPDGPWSPRGNRANDVQALWAGQLLAGADFAAMVGDGDAERRWRELRRRLTSNFLKSFPSDSGVADHLNSDGSPDPQVRPNQIFTSSLLPPDRRIAALTNVVTRLTYDHGVASLWQEDPGFHPYHQHEPFYPKDAAYHNGTVWTWVQGPVISELCTFGKQDLAFRITCNSVNQILDRGAVGAQSELLDAVPLPGKSFPELSGTVSQAWNLAEFIRNFYDDYLGIRIQRFDHTLRLRPALPRELGNVRAVVNLEGVKVPIEVSGPSGARIIQIDASELKKGGDGTLVVVDSLGREREGSFKITPGAVLQVTVHSNELKIYNKIDYTTHSFPISNPGEPPLFPQDLVLATPEVAPALRSLRGPGYPLLSHATVRRKSAGAVLVAEGVDPDHDDSGISSDGRPLGRLTYPKNPNFIPGSIDLVGLQVSRDDSLAYFAVRFRALADPGWHPEYGFQLTFAAIAIDADGIPGSGGTAVGRNSDFALDPARAFERLIFVGGGISVHDARGNTLAAYLPVAADASDPIGDTRSGTVRFALPLSLLPGEPKSWTLTVLAGAQDDHGGAGIGEFRRVTAEAGEWTGGGRGSGESNVYDMLIVPTP